MAGGNPAGAPCSRPREGRVPVQNVLLRPLGRGGARDHRARGTGRRTARRRDRRSRARGPGPLASRKP
eukprot:6313600-Prymnesium_polylepis.1